MATASSASATKGHARSASEYTATDRMPSERQARMMRRAISPRLATRTLESKGSGEMGRVDRAEVEARRPPATLVRHPPGDDHDRAVRALESDLHQSVAAHAR